MSFTQAGNAPYIVKTASFSKSTNDELLKANGNYEFCLPVREGFVWDFDFILAFDEWLTNNSAQLKLTTADRVQINEFVAYADAAEKNNARLNSLDYLLSIPNKTTTISTMKDTEWAVS